MKPGYIFSAVFVVALFMAIGLPQLVVASPAAAGTAQTSITEQQAVKAELAGAAAPATEAQPAAGQSPAAVGSLPQASDAAGSGAGDGIPLTSLVKNAPDLQSFIDTVVNNRPEQVVGVYVPGLFALPILQQPADDMNYISPFDGTLTQYSPPIDHGVISLLAHNYLAGRVYFNLQVGHAVTLVYGDGRLEQYRVTVIDRYQALSPLDPYSNFIDQADPSGAVQSFQQVYDRYYKTGNQVVFQTCIEKNGDLSWGRIFVVAQPY